MKIRFGFVTNSSSSSFIIYTSDPHAKGVISTKKELNAWFLKRYAFSHYKSIEDLFEYNESFRETYQRYHDMLASGKSFLPWSVDTSYPNDDLTSLLNKLRFEVEWDESW